MEITTFGGLALIGPEGRLLQVQRRRLALLALIAVAGRRGISRERLLGILWPDTDEERGRGALAQALYAVRRDLGREDLLTGTTELIIPPDALRVDALAFEEDLAAGRLADAVERYRGPFLDGFYVPDAPDFERWAEERRAHYARAFSEGLERLAGETHAAGRPRDALVHWRRLAALEPHNARVAMGLMRSAAAAGDPAGAVKHARVYAALMEQDELPADPNVMKLAEALADGAGQAVRAAQALGRAHRDEGLKRPDNVTAAVDVATPESQAHRPVSRRRWRLLAAIAAGALVLTALTGLWLGRGGAPSATIAVGRFEDHSGDPAAAALSSMLTTSLGRVPGLSVVSTARMYELTRGDTARTFTAARRAKAGVLLDGALFRTPDGGLRLELRRIAVATGQVLDASRIEGGDLFAVVDGATAEVAAAGGAGAPARPLAEQTTTSLTAFRLYSEGLRAYHAGNMEGARALLDAAVAEDSTFALAWRWAARARQHDLAAWRPRIERALALAPRAPDRERLLILLDWANQMDLPGRLAIAETLATQFPRDAEAQLQYGSALQWDGRFGAAAAVYARAMELDAGGLRAARLGERCLACEALAGQVGVLRMADSVEASVRLARQWTREAPGWAEAWYALADALMYAGRADEAYAAERVAAPLGEPARAERLRALIALHAAEDWDGAERYYRRQVERPEPEHQRNGLWWLAIVRRQQGLLDEALELAQRCSALGCPRGLEAQVHFERAEYAAAARLFRAIADAPRPEVVPTRNAREIAWYLTHTATALAAAGDTAPLLALADSVEGLGRQTAYGRDRRLHHHIRGLLYAARGRTDEAVESFERAIFSPTVGYSRSSYEAARLLLQADKAQAAVRYLRPILHGGLEASGLYLTRTDVHALLGHAFEAAGQPDSAAAHYRRVLASWAQADPVVAARREAVQAGLARLGSR